MKHVFVRDLRVSKTFKEPFVFVNRDITFLSVPDGSKRIDGLPIKPDWISNKLRELLANFFNDWLLTELTTFWCQLQYDFGSPIEVKVVDI